MPLHKTPPPIATRSTPHATLLQRSVRLGRKALRDSKLVRGALSLAALIAFTLVSAVVFQRLFVPSVRTVTAIQVDRRTALIPIDDSVARAGAERFSYSGIWQHLANERDGRSKGTSSRSYHIGAKANFEFTGERLELFGVRGRNGGYAELRIDGQTYGLLRFYAPHKEAGVAIYTSSTLPAGRHRVDIVVLRAPNGLPKRRFVNLDGAAYASH